MPSSPVIVAYDGSPNARDALALGSVLASTCEAPLALASVYRPAASGPREADGPQRERDRLLRERTQELLAEGARSLGRGADVALHALAATTTAEGIRALAEREGALMVVFGSAQGTLPAHVRPGSASRRLLQRLGCALALAPVGFGSRSPEAFTAVVVADDDDQHTARRSAEALAKRRGARLADARQLGDGEGDSLLLVGSATQAREGQLMVNARASALIQTASAPVLVLPRGRELPVSVAAVAA